MSATAVAPSAAAERPAHKEPGDVLSPSQVRCYTDCQAKWQFRYVLKLKSPQTAAAARGQSIHEALAMNFVQKVDSEEDAPVDDILHIYRRAWTHFSAEAVFLPNQEPAEVAARGQELVKQYMETCAPAIQPAAVEIDVQGAIAGVSVRGRLDLLDNSGRVIDIKSTLQKPRWIDHNQAIQLTTYSRLTPGASGYVRVDSLVTAKQPQIVQIGRALTDADLLATERIYPLAQRGMRTGVCMPNRNSNGCSRMLCPYWAECEKEFGGVVDAV